MLQLYYDRACPFCLRVLHYMEAREIPFEHKSFSLMGSSQERSELIELTGRSRVPYLVDPERNVSMPESMDILRYLEEHYV